MFTNATVAPERKLFGISVIAHRIDVTNPGFSVGFSSSSMEA